MRRIFLAAGALAALLGAACNGGKMEGPGTNCVNGVCPFTNVAAPANGVAQFSVVPVAPGPGQSLTALGNLNPPGHVLPTDHVYFYPGDLSGGSGPFGSGTRNVYMPATGALFLNLQSGTIGGKFMFRATQNFYFYLDHMVPVIAMNIGDVIQAGTLIGKTDPGGTLDLGAFDESVTHDGFVTPSRYPEQTLHYVSPWKYFAPALQPALYAQLYRAPTATDKDGKIDFSVAGKLAGDWYLQGLAADNTSAGPTGWPQTVAFVYDYYDPSKVRISIGGTIGSPGVWATDSASPRPENVSMANGLVIYPLINPFDGGPPVGRVLVQMVTSSQIKIELFMGANAGQTQFDANAFTFIR
jgi:hypothetical protein